MSDRSEVHISLTLLGRDSIDLLESPNNAAQASVSPTGTGDEEESPIRLFVGAIPLEITDEEYLYQYFQGTSRYIYIRLCSFTNQRKRLSVKIDYSSMTLCLYQYYWCL